MGRQQKDEDSESAQGIVLSADHRSSLEGLRPLDDIDAPYVFEQGEGVCVPRSGERFTDDAENDALAAPPWFARPRSPLMSQPF